MCTVHIHKGVWKVTILKGKKPSLQNPQKVLKITKKGVFEKGQKNSVRPPRHTRKWSLGIALHIVPSALNRELRDVSAAVAVLAVMV
jgi:hypothetical protein